MVSDIQCGGLRIDGSMVVEPVSVSNFAMSKIWCIGTAKTDVCRLGVALTSACARGLETCKSSALLEFRV